MKTTLMVLRGLLLTWGSVSLIVVIALAALLLYSQGPGNKDQTDSASVQDARNILDRCEMPDLRVAKVVHSFVSAQSFTGDHFDIYAVKTSSVDIMKLAATARTRQGPWFRGDQLPAVASDALTFAESSSYSYSWCPNESAIRTANYYVCPLSSTFSGVRVTSTDLAIIRPSDNMIFYISEKT